MLSVIRMLKAFRKLSPPPSLDRVIITMDKLEVISNQKSAETLAPLSYHLGK